MAKISGRVHGNLELAVERQVGKNEREGKMAIAKADFYG